MRFLTFDLGTTLYKVALFDDAGRMLAVRRLAPEILHPKESWWELDPRTFHQPLLDAARQVREEVGGFDDVAAVSFATQANSFVLLGERDEALTPIVLWPDQRAAELVDELQSLFQIPGFGRTTGMPRFNHALALAKVLRWKHQNPHLLEQTRRFCYLSDLLTLWMMDQHVTEGGVAGLSGAMDVNAFDWWDKMLSAVGVARRIMPRIVRAGTDLGPVKQQVADEIGLPRSCRFVVGCLDQYAGAIGTAAVESGRVCETTGTVLAAVRCADRLEDRQNIFQGPSFDLNRFFQMSFSSTSANLLEWYRNSLPNPLSFEELSELAATAPPCDLVIEPYGDSISECFRHVGSDHTPGQIVREIMQRVADSLATQIDELCGDERPSEIRSAGGASKNDLWLQMKANTLGVPFVAMQCEEPTSLGAAILAASGIGLGDVPTLAQRWVKVRKRFDPR